MSATSKRSPSQSKDITTSSSATVTSPAGASSTKTPLSQSIRDSVMGILHKSNTNGGGRSPASPSRISRLQEKEEMQNLNERLVIYIDTVRRLESENQHLHQTIRTYSENSVRDVADIKRMYETELEDAKRLIDELARDKAKFEIEVNKHKADAEDALGKLTRREQAHRTLDDKFKAAESEALEFKRR